MHSYLPDLHKKLAGIIEPIADHYGEVLYSPVEFLKPSPVYLLGYNPGLSAAGDIVGEHLDFSFKRTNNAWIDGAWNNGQKKSNLQKRMWKLFEDAGLDLMSTPSSNLIFAASKDASKVDYKIADICWPAHQAIMEIVQPSKLIVFGNGEHKSPFSFIRSKYGGDDERFVVHRGHTLKRLRTVIDGRPTEVIALAHLSRFPPPPKAIEWLQSK